MIYDSTLSDFKIKVLQEDLRKWISDNIFKSTIPIHMTDMINDHHMSNVYYHESVATI